MPGSRVPEIVNLAVDMLIADTGFTALLGGPKVYTHPPQKTAAPFALVEGGDEVPWTVDMPDPDNAARQVDVMVQLASTYKGQTEVNDLASRCMEVLLDEALWVSLSGLHLVEFVKNQFQPPADLMSDGVLWYVRIVSVKVSVE